MSRNTAVVALVLIVTASLLVGLVLGRSREDVIAVTSEQIPDNSIVQQSEQSNNQSVDESRRAVPTKPLSELAADSRQAVPRDRAAWLRSDVRNIAGVSHETINDELTAAFLESPVSQVAYIEKLGCEGQYCTMDLRFFDSRRAASTTSNFLREINEMFASDKTRSGLQMTLVSIGKGDSGDSITSFRIQDYEAPSYESEVTEDGAIITRYVGDD